MSENRNDKKAAANRKKRGFYLSLAICLVAVGIAAWSTYDAVHDVVTSDNLSSAVEEEAYSVGDDDEDGELLNKSSSQVPENDTEEQSAAETAGAIGSESSSIEEESKTEETNADITDPNEIPADSKVVYEISEILSYPVNSTEITKKYSKGEPAYSETMKDWRIHNGIDIKAESGEEVKASGNGIVLETYTDAYLGNVVVIEHGDYVFYYCGLGEDFVVKEGDIVSSGQTIGTITAVPFEAAEDTHLHLEVKNDDVNLDPTDVLTAN